MPETRYSALNTGGSRVSNADDDERRLAQDYMFKAALASQQAGLQSRGLDLQSRGQDMQERMFNTGEAGQNSRYGQGLQHDLTVNGAFSDKAGLSRDLAKGQQDTQLSAARIGNEPAMGALALQGRAYDDSRKTPEAAIHGILYQALQGNGQGMDPAMMKSLISGAVRKYAGEDPDVARNNARADQLWAAQLDAARQGNQGAIDAINKQNPGAGSAFMPNPAAAQAGRAAAAQVSDVGVLRQLEPVIAEAEKMISGNTFSVSQGDVQKVGVQIQAILDQAQLAGATPEQIAAIKGRIRDRLLSASSNTSTFGLRPWGAGKVDTKISDLLK